MKKFTLKLMLIGVLFFGNSNTMQGAKLTIYNNYEDYVSNQGIHYEGDFEFREITKHMSLNAAKFRNVDKEHGERRVKVKLWVVWGFQFGDHLFRVTEKYDVPVYVRQEGSLIYYENGAAILRMLKLGKSLDQDTYSYETKTTRPPVVMDSSLITASMFVSKTLKSRIYPFSPKEKKKLIELLPEIAAVYECLDGSVGIQMKRSRMCFDEVIKAP
ncbi:hypothetical protein N9B82_05970 [Saprospiraceae bacterium]|nr:hypothetical protein [Saprospiraceae bacterium]